MKKKFGKDYKDFKKIIANKYNKEIDTIKELKEKSIKNIKHLENIKSNNRNNLYDVNYFIRKLFSHIDEKTKLKIIKYNNNLKNKLDIKLNNYKNLSNRYIIYDPNIKGKGKEYNFKDNRLLFEGEYLNGEKNGKGKEYKYN